jgi:N-hydroxyarylamine O-acetyltransferase
MHMDVRDYLDRIGYRGPVAPTLDCLTEVHRCHALTIPYENLDIQLGRPVSHRIEDVFDKLVRRRRGGWCYEMNGLLCWGLREIGFDVLRATGGIHRRERGDSAMGNHLVLLVNLDRIYVADLGLGDGMRLPLPLAEGEHTQCDLTFRVAALEGGIWRIFNHSFGYPTDYDLRLEEADESDLCSYAEQLQTSPDSVFVQNLDCELMSDNAITCLTGRVLRKKSASGTVRRLIGSPDEMHAVLRETFGISGVDLAPVWPRICERHQVLFGDQPLDQTEDVDI